jgi:protein-S-isoprenylcysteine O-methyltransferase Ste14
MYAGGLIMFLGMPLALGSWWGLLAMIPITLLFAWRLLDEERFLVENLPGYTRYLETVRYRLVPLVW